MRFFHLFSLMLLQSCHLGVLGVFSFPLGLWNKLKSFSYFSEKCKSDMWYNWCSQRRLYRLCTRWFIRIEMCVLIIFMVLYSQHITIEKWAGFFAVVPVSCTRQGCCFSGVLSLCLLSFQHPGWALDALGEDFPIASVGGPLDLLLQSQCIPVFQ